MSIPGDASPLLLGGGAQQYKIERSLRFNSSDSAYLSRTPASAGNRKTWTLSCWVKATKFDTYRGVFEGYTGSPTFSNRTSLQINNTNQIDVLFDNNTSGRLTTTQVFRDPSAWYHLLFGCDTTQSTASNRFKIYVNGSQVTTFSNASYPAQNLDTGINTTQPLYFGRVVDPLYADFYLADIHFIDGQALDPTSFAETNITTGQWVPKAYTGTYGTNGFRLAFADNSNNTATTLGKDSSPNGNNFTPNNLSVTAGAGNDSLVDTPTSYGTDTGAGGEVRGNYATLNPLLANATLANGNLDISGGAADFWRHSTIGCSSGKWYAEMTVGSSSSLGLGIYSQSALNSSVNASQSRGYFINGQKYSNGSLFTYGNSFTTNDVIGIAFDVDAGKVWFSKNGAWQASGDPVAGTNAAFTDIANNTWFVTIQGATFSASANFGQRPFAYTAPSGFKALCDTNLPAPVVAKPNSVFDVKLYTGDGTTSARAISGIGFSPDLVWIKNRNAAYSHTLYDTVRGVGPNKALFSNGTFSEGGNPGSDDATYGYLSAFNSDGFSVTKGTDATSYTNGSSQPYVAWTWDAGSSTVTNTQGSITSQVRANASAGFSIVTFTMGSGSYTVGHGLGVAPSLLITKARSNTSSWWTYHASLGTGSYLALNTTAAAATDYSWGTAPTSTVFTANNNFFSNAYTYVVYCFAPVAGYSSFGSYTGNGSADGPFVFLGFRPAVVIVKMSSSTGNWTILDYQRQGYNVDNDPLFPNLSNTEGTTDLIDLTSNGFKVRTTDATFNTNAGTYVYAAWAQNPYQYARAR